jgi:transcriptional regulatory protein RtcR
MTSKKITVIGFLGTQLDAGHNNARWEKWRPTVSLGQHEELQVGTMEVFHGRQHTALMQRVSEDIATASPQTKLNAVLMELANPWDFGEVYAALYDWARGYAFDTDTTDYWVHITTGTHVTQICLFLLVEARIIPGVLLQTGPPKGRDVATRGPGTYELIDLDLSKYDALAARLGAAQTDAVQFLKSGIATKSARFNHLIDEVERVAVRSTAPVLLTGPTGAGKSMLAARLYALKKSRHLVTGAFVDVNCATLRGDGAASSLFGHVKGAFTGAATERSGLLRAAHDGVLFLDEIGELGADEQAMLLKAIEDKSFMPVGADKPVNCRFQLIAGTNRDLRQDVASGRFRADLLARINVWVYALPSLADRVEDIEPNLEHLLQSLAGELGKQVRFNLEARAAYLNFALSKEALWTGNFRDLGASITRLATLAEGGRITTEDVKAEILRLQWIWADAGGQTSSSGTEVSDTELTALLADQPLDPFDAVQLKSVIQVCRHSSSLSDAGRQLFAVSRLQRSVVNDADRLRKYLARFDLTWERVAN